MMYVTPIKNLKQALNLRLVSKNFIKSLNSIKKLGQNHTLI